MVSNTIVRKHVRVRIPLPALRGRSRHRRERPLYPSTMRIQKSLSEVGEQLNKARDELRIVEEQLLFQMDVEEETKTRALVAETPLADREHQEAQRDLERIRRSRDEVTAKIAELQAEQDRLLDKLND